MSQHNANVRKQGVFTVLQAIPFKPAVSWDGLIKTWTNLPTLLWAGPIYDAFVLVTTTPYDLCESSSCDQNKVLDMSALNFCYAN